eukprot:6208795-Pleurochrysis_carterae.AAC.1
MCDKLGLEFPISRCYYEIMPLSAPNHDQIANYAHNLQARQMKGKSRSGLATSTLFALDKTTDSRVSVRS